MYNFDDNTSAIDKILESTLHPILSINIVIMNIVSIHMVRSNTSIYNQHDQYPPRLPSRPATYASTCPHKTNLICKGTQWLSGGQFRTGVVMSHIQPGLQLDCQWDSWSTSFHKMADILTDHLE